MFKSDKQEAMYDKIWQKIVTDTGRSDRFVKDTKTFILYSDDLPVDREFLINKMTIVIKSILECNNRVLSTNFFKLLLI